MPATVTSEGETEGSLRFAETRDGARQTERLIKSAPEQFFYRYTLESGPMPVRDYAAELRVKDDGDNASTVVWSAEFEPTLTDFRTVEQIRDFLKVGLRSIVVLHRRVLR